MRQLPVSDVLSGLSVSFSCLPVGVSVFTRLSCPTPAASHLLRYHLATLMLIAAPLEIMKLPQRRMGNSGSSTPPPPPDDIESNAALELHLLHFVRARLQLSFPQCPAHPVCRAPPPFLYPPASQTSAKHHTVILSPPYRLKTIGSSLTALLTVRLLSLSKSSDPKLVHASHCIARRTLSRRMAAALLVLQIRPDPVCKVNQSGPNGHSLPVTSIALNADASLAVTCSNDSLFKLWQLRRDGHCRQYRRHLHAPPARHHTHLTPP